MRKLKLHPTEEQFEWRCACGAKSEGVVQASVLSPLLDVFDAGHATHLRIVKTRKPGRDEQTRVLPETKENNRESFQERI